MMQFQMSASGDRSAIRVLNVRRGFNRIFLVLTLGWALLCAVLFPLKLLWNGQNEALIRYDKDVKTCQQLAVDAREPEEIENCNKQAIDEMSAALAERSYGKFWQFDVVFWQIEIPVILLPPVLLYGIVALIWWLVAGFAKREV